jgi:hypothetical protein
MAYTNKFRYRNRSVFANSDDLYDELLEARGVERIQQYVTADNIDLTKISDIKTIPHAWKTGDRYFKLANQYYGRPELWWIIALYNKAPTESLLKRGNVILIPTPVEQLLYYL